MTVPRASQILLDRQPNNPELDNIASLIHQMQNHPNAANWRFGRTVPLRLDPGATCANLPRARQGLTREAMNPEKIQP